MSAWDRAAATLEGVGSPARAVARRHWWLIALTTIVAVGIAVAGLSLVTPSYQATATLQTPIATGVQAPTDLTYLDRLMNTYTQLAQQPSLRAEVARRLGAAYLPSLAVTIEPNTELLQLSAADPSRTVAQRTANIAASVLVSRVSAFAQATSQAGETVLGAQLDTLSTSITALRIQLAQIPSGTADTSRRVRLEQSISGKQANYQALVQQRAQLQLADAMHSQTLSVVQAASEPSSPSSPKWPPVLALALGLGLIGGLGLAFTLERFLPRLYTVEAIESAAAAQVLVAIPTVTGEHAATPLYNGCSPAQEAFGVLAVHVLAESHSRQLQTILVTSRRPGDGKSAVSSNLAAELARSGHRVVLVDADMRSSSVEGIFGIDASGGLSNLLEAELTSSLDEFIVQSEEIPNLGVLPSGPHPAGPARLLASSRLNGLIDQLKARYEFVVFDAPPLVVSDPLSIARLADLVLLVVGGAAVPDRDIHAATRQLSSIGTEHVAVVVNRWRGHEASYNYSYRSA